MKTLFATLFLGLFLHISLLAGDGNKIGIGLQYGFPELLSLGFRVQLPQAQLGMSAGFLGEYRQVSGDVYYHFGGESGYSDRRPWFMHTGLMFFKEKLKYRTTKCTFVPLRIGRDLNLTEHVGFVIDFGVAIKLSEKETEHYPTTGRPAYAIMGMFGDAGGDAFPGVMPCFGIGFFVKF